MSSISLPNAWERSQARQSPISITAHQVEDDASSVASGSRPSSTLSSNIDVTRTSSRQPDHQCEREINKSALKRCSSPTATAKVKPLAFSTNVYNNYGKPVSSNTISKALSAGVKRQASNISIGEHSLANKEALKSLKIDMRRFEVAQQNADRAAVKLHNADREYDLALKECRTNWKAMKNFEEASDKDILDKISLLRNDQQMSVHLQSFIGMLTRTEWCHSQKQYMLSQLKICVTKLSNAQDDYNGAAGRLDMHKKNYYQALEKFKEEWRKIKLSQEIVEKDIEHKVGL